MRSIYEFFFITTTWPADIRPHLALFTLWVMTTATCLVVANIYYNQPLLADIAHTFEISDKKARQVSLSTQIGYATGLLFIIPLADMLKLKRLILIDFILVIINKRCSGCRTPHQLQKKRTELKQVFGY